MGSEARRLERNVAPLVADGVPEELARTCAALLDTFSLLDIADISAERGRDPQVVAPLYFHVSERQGRRTAGQDHPTLPRGQLGCPGPRSAA